MPKILFQKGHPKVGGRTGWPNKNSAVAHVRAEEEARVRLALARLVSQDEIEHVAGKDARYVAA